MQMHVRVAFVAGLLAAAAFPMTFQTPAWAQNSGGGSNATGSNNSGANSNATNSNSGNAGAPTQGGNNAATEGGAATQRTTPGANSGSGTAVNRDDKRATSPGTRPTSQLQRVNSQDYLNQIASSDMFEIASSQLALERSSNANVQAFARKMVSDHQQASQRVTQALSNGGSNNLRMPAQMSAQHQQMLERLRGAGRDASFDRMYLDMQVRGHEQALALHRSYGNTGDNVALQTAAKEMAPVVQQHLAEVRRLAGNRSQSKKNGDKTSAPRS